MQVILTFGSSALVRKILTSVIAKKGKRGVTLVVIDNRPLRFLLLRETS